MKVLKSSSWKEKEIYTFLNSTVIPMRVAANFDGCPLICSIWFKFKEEAQMIIGATQDSSRLAQILKEVPRCAFEISTNNTPYRGVRGQATVALSKDNAEDALQELIDRYLGKTNTELANWLINRSDKEVMIELKPEWISSWDYSSRMSF
ncbi:MAG: pyridoxamine 5'-phosphate oxidase family protein [Pseudomonadota bacterium]|nr:pyridoxamine 5'-phosphate oxidase family protein [Pseudomonadota bacterium]